jgi:uncharacterized protein
LKPKEANIEQLSALEILYCCIVVVLSYAVRGSTGFGAAAAMPLLGLVVPLKILIPVWTLLGIASSLPIVGRDHRYIAVFDLLRTLPTALIGIALGLYFFTMLDAKSLARGLGALVASYGCYSLWAGNSPSRFHTPPRFIAPIAGILGGAVGTTFGTMASIFYAIYFDAIRMAKEHFRATMSAMILTLSIIRGIGYYAVGEFSTSALLTFLAAFPLMLIGIFIGDRFHANMTDLTFKRLVGVVLIASGLALLVK